MRKWPAKTADVSFEHILDACLIEGPQLLTRDDLPVAVLLAMGEWTRVQAGAKMTLKQLLLAPSPRHEGLTPLRSGNTKQSRFPLR